jgi:aminopeptidase YwaD
MSAGKDNMETLQQKSEAYLQLLCNQTAGRSVGSQGNREAANFFKDILTSLGWRTETQGFIALDWLDGGASLRCGLDNFQVLVSPYSLGCKAEEQLICVSSIEELEKTIMRGKILLLHGEIAKEQLMPKNFVFYNPMEHQHILALLEKGSPRAIICATGRNAALAGGAYPFPLIEDGDFDIPSVYMTEEEGRRLVEYTGNKVTLNSKSRRVPGEGCNVIGRKGMASGKRIVITAHIDAKKGSPGALDNASGVVVLLLLAELLRDYVGTRMIELVALNGEDYYAVPGQMEYIRCNQDRFHEILVNINIDGAGYKEGDTAFSFYGLSEGMEATAREIIFYFEGVTAGSPWVQGDHSVFIQYGCPAMAVTSQWFSEHIDSQEITHTPKDNIEMIDVQKLVEIARVLDRLVRNI